MYVHIVVAVVAGDTSDQLRPGLHASAVERIVVAAAKSRNRALHRVAFGGAWHNRAPEIRVSAVAQHLAESIGSRRGVDDDVLHPAVAAVDKADGMGPVADGLRIAVCVAAKRPHRDVANLAAPVAATRNQVPARARARDLFASQAHWIHEIAGLPVIRLYRPDARFVGVAVHDLDIPFAVGADRADDALRERETFRIVDDGVLERHAVAVVQTDHSAAELSTKLRTLEINRHSLCVLEVD